MWQIVLEIRRRLSHPCAFAPPRCFRRSEQVEDTPERNAHPVGPVVQLVVELVERLVEHEAAAAARRAARDRRAGTARRRRSRNSRAGTRPTPRSARCAPMARAAELRRPRRGVREQAGIRGVAERPQHAGDILQWRLLLAALCAAAAPAPPRSRAGRNPLRPRAPGRGGSRRGPGSSSRRTRTAVRTGSGRAALRASRQQRACSAITCGAGVGRLTVGRRSSACGRRVERLERALGQRDRLGAERLEILLRERLWREGRVGRVRGERQVHLGGPPSELGRQLRGTRPSPPAPRGGISAAASSVKRRRTSRPAPGRCRPGRRSGRARRSRASSRRPGFRPAAASCRGWPARRRRLVLERAGHRRHAREADLLGELPADLEVGVDARLDPPEQLQDQPVAVDDRRVALLAGRAG